MNHIGDKIKELRRKNNMTQEKLAERLDVSYQTVSKWETGITSPDLSLIVPLARLFKITTDELFCYNENADALRRKELEDEYEATWKSGDLEERYKISERAVKEFPDDMEWLDRFAWAQALCSFGYEDDEEYKRQQEEAIAKFASVIENTTDGEVRASAIHGIVQYLSFRGRNDEAKSYAQMYPKNYPVSADEVLLSCLVGEEKIVHYQGMLDHALIKVINLLTEKEGEEGVKAAEKIIKIMLPDGNYSYYHCMLSEIYRRRARNGMEASDSDTAAEMLKLALYHGRKYDEYIKGKDTAKSKPFFDHYSINVGDVVRTGTTTMEEDVIEFIKRPLFDPLREKIADILSV